MAARTYNIATLCLPRDMCKAEKNEMATKLGFYRSRRVAMITSKNGKFSVRSSAGGTPRSVETINGKVNGVHVGEGTLFGNKNSTELIKDSDIDAPAHSSLHGNFVEGSHWLQETALNHVTSSGLAGNGFGATREMSIRKLIWVVTRIFIQVQRYSSWGDVVEIDTWVDAAGKNGMRRDWIIRDYKTQEIITRATSTWVIMNRETRRLSKIPEQVRQEVLPFYLNRVAVAAEKNDSEKIDKLTDGTAGRIRSGLAPRWSDMDANQHVNNVKYIGWILESVPINVLGDYDLTSMTLEYRRECRQSNLLESMTSARASLAEDSSCKNNSINRRPDLEYTHLLRMQADKAEIVRARTEWHLKRKHKLH
ncbi:unnamed protein product [Prunus armeniaca]|uniref:Acyl-[acyl-carrier-protein] hydrolase n=1 Tax=Prunus armeniaca TaxID=36596 RepID=A0A6J5UUZ6_PRUAR|nr:unnamed protein product [Prunus armeniaca]